MKTPALLFIILIFGLSACDEKETNAPVYLKYTCDETGIIHDYTGLDGCGFVIELTDGHVLEPQFIDDSTFIFEDGKPITLSYTVPAEYGSVCMVGTVVHITCISELCSTAIQDFGFFFNPEDYPQDGFAISEVEILGDCIYVTVGYSGGCTEHDFMLGVVWPECGTPPVPPPVLYLCHNANGDLCEAYITETVTFDLSLLQQMDSTSTTFQLRQNFPPSSYGGQFDYQY
ncbi:MAG: hypothetical protein K9H64_15020 [Bacteroidales bacterium]|nr:hypothetical protein [Bacteroidales bacterium]MCF8457317.1 hypothetical protein [Bacteroidales bacterium]